MATCPPYVAAVVPPCTSLPATVVDFPKNSGLTLQGSRAMDDVLTQLQCVIDISGAQLVVTLVDYADATYYYFGGTDIYGWRINRYLIASPGPVESTTTGAADLATAWTNRTSLTYA